MNLATHRTFDYIGVQRKWDREKRQAIKVALAHWRRMIAWVERLTSENPDILKSVPLMTIMLAALKENWSGEHCALCDLYSVGEKIVCADCPLGVQFGNCGYPNHRKRFKNAWRGVVSSATWREWLYHARRMARQIESLVA